jgi:hypothetical protein
VTTIETITLDVARYEISQDDVDAAEEVFAAARSLRAAVSAAGANEP